MSMTMDTMNYYIGLDLGTTGCKSTVFDEDGRVCGNAYIEYGLLVDGDFVERDPNDWWEFSCQAIDGALQEAGCKREAVRGLSISSQGISFVLLDKEGRPLGNAVNWLDMRAVEQARRLEERWPQGEWFRLTGKRPGPSYILPKLLWLREHEPERWAQADILLTAHDFLLWKLTGRYATEHTMAGGSLLYSLEERGWDRRILRAFSISPEILPPICTAGTAFLLTEAARARLGLGEGTVVAVGGQDQKIAAFGAGIGPDIATLSLGTAGAMEFLCPRPVFDERDRLPLFTYLFDGQWVAESVISTSGVALKWLRNTLFPGVSYSRLDELAAAAQPGAGGVCFFPHLTGASSPHWEADAKGGFCGITLNTTAGDLVRSVLEGIAFELKENMDVYREASGLPIREVRAFGGGASSAVWCEILCGICGVPVRAFSCPEIANYGAARLAFIGAEEHDGLGRQMLEDTVVYTPGEDTAALYRDIDAYYKKQEAAFLGSERE